MIQKEEVDVTDVALAKLAEQFAKKLDAIGEIDRSAQWLALTATLLLLKSQKLIPGEEVEEEELPRIEVFQKLLEYCRFKDAASALSHMENKQRLFYSRGQKECPKRSASGLEEVSLDELTSLLQEVMLRVPQIKVIEKEVWEVAPKMEWLLQALEKDRLTFEAIFNEEKCKDELIVCFLALLELMKMEEVRVVRDGGIYVESTRC